MRLSRRNRNHVAGDVAGPLPVTYEQPTKPAKAVVAAVVTVLGLVGIHVTGGTAQAIVMAGQFLLVVYGVWRTRNRPKHSPSRGLRAFL